MTEPIPMQCKHGRPIEATGRREGNVMHIEQKPGYCDSCEGYAEGWAAGWREAKEHCASTSTS